MEFVNKTKVRKTYRKPLTPNTSFNLKVQHRNKERLRHQTINKRIAELCFLIPGDCEKETKIWRLQRVIRYCYFLADVIENLSNELDILSEDCRFFSQLCKNDSSPQTEKHECSSEVYTEELDFNNESGSNCEDFYSLINGDLSQQHSNMIQTFVNMTRNDTHQSSTSPCEKQKSHSTFLEIIEKPKISKVLSDIDVSSDKQSTKSSFEKMDINNEENFLLERNGWCLSENSSNDMSENFPVHYNSNSTPDTKFNVKISQFCKTKTKTSLHRKPNEKRKYVR